MKVRSTTVAVVSLLVVAGHPLPNANAAVMFDVEVGRFFDESDHTAESMRFFPASIKVVPGDTIHFSTKSFHGVTLLPTDQQPETWSANNASPGGPWSVFESDPDEGVNAARVNLTIATPSGPCGWPTQEPCEFDGSGDEVFGPLNSGLPLFPGESGTETRQLSFDVTITADPGTTIYALDPLHPAMTMQIDVVDTFTERSDPIELDTESDQQFADDQTRATELDTTYSKKKVKKSVKGKTVWKAWAGLEEEGISLRRMYPKKLTIKPGNRVRWNFSTNLYEAHSVTFPQTRAVALAGAFPDIVCDSNGDQDPAPDSEPSSDDFPFCASFAELELDVPPAMVVKSGDGVVKSTKDIEASGARGATYAPTAKSYELSFPKKSSRSGFKYACAIHEAAHAPMRATVVVKR